MEELKAGSKLARQIIEEYRSILRSKKGPLHIGDVYPKPSSRKYWAWWGCENECNKHGGELLTIVRYNRYQFSVVFQFRKDNKRYYCYMTKSHQYCIPVK